MIEQIDLLWIKGRIIKAVFEVESTTSMTSALMRGSNIDQAVDKFMVIPEEREPQFKNKMTSPLFNEHFENENWKIAAHYIGNKLISFFANLLYGKNLTDIETCYKIFTKKVKDSLDLRLNDFGFEVEFFSQICKRNYRIAELPIEYMPRVWAEGKKINWRDGVKAIWYLFKMKFGG